MAALRHLVSSQRVDQELLQHVQKQVLEPVHLCRREPRDRWPLLVVEPAEADASASLAWLSLATVVLRHPFCAPRSEASTLVLVFPLEPFRCERGCWPRYLRRVCALPHVLSRALP